MIRPCKCDHAYQDSQYGKFNRVMNPCKPNSGKPTKVRCTVCKAEYDFSKKEEDPKSTKPKK